MTDGFARNIAIVVTVAAFFLMFWFLIWPGSVWGGAVDYPLRFVGDYDSVHVIWSEKDALVWGPEDSVWFTSIPDSAASIELDDAKDWKVDYCYFSGGAQICVGQFIKFTAGAATISSTDKEEIAGLVEDTLEVHHGAGSWTTGTGSGSNAVKYYAVDTSGTDEAIMDVQITVKTIAGVFDAGQPTNASGYFDFTLPTDSMVAYGRKCGYYFFYDTNGITGNLTDTLFGYNVPLQASPDPNLCRVQGYVYIPTGGTTEKIKVTFTISGEAVHNDCDGTALIAKSVTAWTSTHADSLGFFYKDLVPSGCVLKADGDSLQYKITTELGGVKGREDSYWVPQEESYEVVWE